MKKRKSQYKLNKRYWYQSELTYAEDTEVRRIVKESGYQMPQREEEFPTLIDKLYTEKPEMFRRMVAVIIKPETRGWRGVWNKIYKAVDTESLVDTLTKGEIAAILADFFTLRLQWMYDLLNSKTESRLQKKYQRQMEKNLKQMKSVTTSLDRITEKRRN